jgi:hypothetical protein
MKQSFLLLAAAYFINYPSENKIFFTKDEQAFFSENDATNHGKSLRAKQTDEIEVIAVTREEAEAAAGTHSELSAEDQKAAEAARLSTVLVKAEQTALKAKEDYDAAATKLAASPENKTLINSEATRKQKLEAADKAVEEAKAALEQLTSAE